MSKAVSKVQKWRHLLTPIFLNLTALRSLHGRPVKVGFVPAIVCSHTLKNTAAKVCQRALQIWYLHWLKPEQTETGDSRM